MKPLLVSLLPRPPHPWRDGSAIRNYHLLAAIASEFRVRALVLRAPHLPAGEYPPGVEARELPQETRSSRRARAALRSLAGREPYSALLYRSRALEDSLRGEIAAARPARVLAHGYHMGPPAVGCGAPSWIDFHNLDSEIWTRVAETSGSPLARAFARGQAPRVAALEAHLAASAGGLSCVSERDAGALARIAPGRPVRVVPNGVDLSRYRYRAEPAGGGILFFVGDLSWPPNAEGIRWFRDEVWPRVAGACPSATVEVLGRGAPRDLLAGSGERFRLPGEGGDTRPYWARAAVAVVPLLAGGGTRLKILEAAACGVPVVSTPVGAEGLDFEPGSEIAVAAGAEAFAQEILRLLSDFEARRRQAAAARKKVEKLYDWSAIGAAFARELLGRSGGS
jgi:glycosyltransferase involved in cell wall biosynthesis